MIDREKVYTYMDKFHGPIEQSTNGWYSASCPICGKKNKFAINFNYLTGKCWTGCFSGFLIDIIRIYHGSITYFEAKELIDSMEPSLLHIPAAVNRAAKSKIALPRGYHSILEGDGNLAERAREYLIGRGFDLNYMDRIGVGYVTTQDPNPVNDYFGRIIIPFKREGILSYFIGRTFIDDYMRYKNPAKEVCGVGKADLLFNEEALYIEPKVYITEGWACAATIQRAGISQQGSTPGVIQRNMILKSPVKEVILVPDANYYMQGLTTAKYFMQYKKVKVINLAYFEKAGIGKDVNEIGVENLIAQEAKTPWVDPAFLYQQMRLYSKLPVL